MAALWLEGKTPHQIAKSIGRGARTVRAKLGDKGLMGTPGVENAERLVMLASQSGEWPKVKPCIAGCGRNVVLETRNDPRKCHQCAELHAGLSHLEGVAA